MRTQTTDANANRAEAQIARREDEISDSANLVAQKSTKAGRGRSEKPVCAAIGTDEDLRRSNTGRVVIGTKWKKQKARDLWSVGPVPNSQRATLSNLTRAIREAMLRCGGGCSPLTMRSRKLMNLCHAATEHPAFVLELSRFCLSVRRMFWGRTERDAEYRAMDKRMSSTMRARPGQPSVSGSSRDDL